MLFGRSRHRWEDKIKIYLIETLCEDMDWIEWDHDMVSGRILLTQVNFVCR
jgi:hypothetical protein